MVYAAARNVTKQRLDTQAFPASGADVDAAEVAALDTLQHDLPGDAQGRGGDLDGDPAGGGIVGDEVPDFPVRRMRQNPPE